MATVLLTYEHKVGERMMTFETFNVDGSTFIEKWHNALKDYKKPEHKDKDIGDFFVEKIEAGYFEGGEILTLALNGFKQPHDDELKREAMHKMFGELLGGLH